MVKLRGTSNIRRIAHALAIIALAITGSLSVSGGAVCEGIVWSTGERDTSAPQGKLLSDNPGYWGECVLTGVERKEEPVAGDSSRRMITFDFKRPCEFTEVNVLVNSGSPTPIKIETSQGGDTGWVLAFENDLPVKRPGRLSVHRLALDKAKGNLVRITAPASTAVLDAGNIWVWGDGEVSEKYPEHTNRSLLPVQRAAAPDAQSWDGTVDVPAGSYISIPGIEKTVFTGEQFRLWRLSIGPLSRKPAVWSKQPTFGYITNSPLLPAVGDTKDQIAVDTTRSEMENAAIALTNTSTDKALATTVEISEFRRVKDRKIAPEVKAEIRVMGAADAARGFGFDVALYPLFSADNMLGRSLMRKYLTNGEYIADFPRLTLPPGGSAVLWLTVETANAEPGEYEAVLSAKPGARLKVSVRVLDITMPDPYVWVFGWRGVVSDPMQPFRYEQTPARDAAYTCKVLTSAWANAHGTHFLPDPGTEDFTNVMEDQGFREALRLNPRFSIGTWPWRGTPGLLTEAERTMWRQRMHDDVKRLVRNADAMGLSYENWFIAGHDEPTARSFGNWPQWLKMIRDADRNVRTFMNPFMGNVPSWMPWQEVVDELYPWYNDLVDVSVPAMHLLSYPEALSQLWQSPRHVRAFYIVTGPSARREDANESVFRNLAITAFRNGMNGWALFNYSNITWGRTDDPANAGYYSGVIYPGPRGLVPTRASEALREGWEDYRLLTLMRQRNLETEIKSILDAHAAGEPCDKLRASMLQALSKR